MFQDKDAFVPIDVEVLPSRDAPCVSSITTTAGLVLTNLEEITVGVEGTKFRARVEGATGPGQYKFVKLMYDAEEGIEQMEKFSYLQQIGVATPKDVELHEMSDGTPALVVTDLSLGGERLVLSANNPELYEKEVREAIKAIPEAVISQINDKLVEYAVGAAEGPDIRYLLSPNVFALVIDPLIPSSAEVFAIDVGTDLNNARDDLSNEELTYLNLIQVGDFMAMVLGKEISLQGVVGPGDKDAIESHCSETLEYFWRS